MYHGYCTVYDIDPFANKVVQSISEPPPPDKTALGYCVFDTSELYGNNVLTHDGKKLSVSTSPLKCSQCNQYIHKDDNGNCTSYMFDPHQNTTIDDSSSLNSFCDPAHPERAGNCIQPHGMCTVSTVVPLQTCPF